MFKRTLNTILLALTLAFSVNAGNVSGYPIGYCNGEAGSASKLKFDGADKVVSAAIFIPSTYAATVAGNSVDAIRVALCSKLNVEEISVWVRESLDGADLATGSLPIADYAQGWNEVALASPYTISEGCGGFYLGMTYRQSRKSGPISILETPHDNALFVKDGDVAWTDMSDKGILCLEGLVYGDALPQYNAELVGATVDTFFIISNGSLNGSLDVRNLGVETVRNLKVRMTADGMPDCYADADCEIPYGELHEVGIMFRPEIHEMLADRLDATLTIVEINGVTDEDETDNSCPISFQLIEDAYPRMVLLEEFTTENCPNCPRVAEYIHGIMADPAFAPNVVPVCYHAGYGEDFMTTAFAEEYTWFYNDGGGTYAPATMVDRVRHEENSPLFCPASEDELKDAIRARLEYPSLVSLAPVASTDGNGEVRVYVEGHRISADDIADGVRLTVMLVEDNIESRKQAGAGTGYVHQHVGRAVNSTWGVPVEWSGDDYEYSCGFTLDPEWKLDNLKVVAFISDYDSSDPCACEVKNASSCDVVPVSVSEMEEEAGKTLLGVMTADGIRVSAPVKGLNILLYSDGSYRKVMVR